MQKYSFLFSFLLFTCTLFSQNIGIGTNSPAAKLSINGNSAIGTGYINIIPPTNGLIVEGKTGIGTSLPTNALEVVGKTKTTLFQMTNGAVNNYILVSDAVGNGTWTNPATLFGQDWLLDGNNNGAIKSIGTNDNFDFPFETNGNEFMRIKTNNKLGIGTVTPGQYYASAKIEMADMDGNNSDFVMRVANPWNTGIVSYNSFAMQASKGTLLVPALKGSLEYIGNYIFQGFDGSIFQTTAEMAGYTGSNYSLGKASGGLLFSTKDSNDINIIPRMNIIPNGNIGVNVFYPTYKLHIGGDVSVGEDVSIGGNAYPQAGRKLYFGNINGFNADEMTIYNYQNAFEQTDLRINIGNDNGDGQDRLQIGATQTPLTSYIPYVTITNQGRMGIGTTNPIAPLEVMGSTVVNSGNFAFYALAACDNIGCTSGNTEVSILASNRIRALEFNAFSDKRSKNIVSLSDKKADVTTLSALEVTNYTHIDVANKGNAVKKGFIAQQVEAVFPEAVSKAPDFIPNVYAVATKVIYDAQNQQLQLTSPQKHDFVTGDIVRIISDKIYEKPIEVIDNYTFIIKNWQNIPTNEVFIYGKKVTDFRAVDYDRIFTLNVSATQQLIAEVDLLKKQLAILTKEVEKMKAQSHNDF